MTFAYEQDTSHWEPWMHGYRFGVILILPPEPLRSAVNQLRRAHDPRSQSYCEAHISLTVPLPRGPSIAEWEELISLAAGAETFEVRCGPLKHYLPHPGVCLEVAPQQSLDELRRTIESARVFRQSPPRKYPFPAHMTIAEFVTAEQTLGLMDQLAHSAPIGSFICDRLSYVVPDSSFRFQQQATLPLRAPQ
jgi:2'-5' RNA ligase